MAQTLKKKRALALITGGGVPEAPSGWAYWINPDGSFRVDTTGAYLLVRVA